MDPIPVRSGPAVRIRRLHLERLGKAARQLAAVGLAFAFLIGLTGPVRAQAFTWAKHTVEVPPSVETAVGNVLLQNNPAPGASYFAITSVDQLETIKVVSVAAINPADPQNWTIDAAVWVGTVALKPNDNGAYDGALVGTPEYENITAGVIREPAALSVSGTEGGDDLGDFGLPLLPYRAGTSMVFGPRGVHDLGYSMTGWKAVDLVSGSDLGAGHAPNEVYGSTDATVSYVCRDNHSVTIRAGDFYYAHLQDQMALAVGFEVHRGVKFAAMVVGPFSDTCGWAQQQPNHYHLHWGFNGTAQVELEDWRIDPFAQTFTRGGMIVRPGGDVLNFGSSQSDPDVTDPTSQLTGASFWDGIVGGLIGFLHTSVMERFTPATETDYSVTYANAVAVAMRIFFVILASNFKLGVFAFVVGAMLLLEPPRVIYKLYMTIKKAIPFV